MAREGREDLRKGGVTMCKVALCTSGSEVETKASAREKWAAERPQSCTRSKATG